MKPVHYLQLLLLAVIAFSLSCARQTTPTGGPKDSIPPSVVRTLPKDQQVNFQGKQIEAIFDETVQLNNPKEQIIITPGVGKDFVATVKKNTVSIVLDNPPQPNTTYTVNFREAVQDITEKNPATNLHLAFSTGTYIDSLHLLGNVYEILTSNPAKDATIGLYEQDTFNIFKHQPAYFTKADPEGAFHIDNLKPGNYHVYSWIDNNKNLLVDSKSEAYGFLPEIIKPQDTADALHIPLIRLDTRPLKLTSARPAATYFNIKTSKSTESFYITSNEHKIYASYGADHENIQVYNTMHLEAGDSIPITFIAKDSLLQSIDTTLYLQFSQRAIKPQPFKLETEEFSLSGATGQLHGLVILNKPALHINYDSIYYRIDSALTIPLAPQDVTFDSTRTQLTIHKQIERALLAPKPPANKPTTSRPPTDKPKTAQPPPATKPTDKTTPQKKPVNNYELYFQPSAIISAEIDSSKANSIALRPTTMETTGVIILELKTTKTQLLVQLLSRGKVIAQQTGKRKTTFSDLSPGDYTLRVVEDKDNNNRWSPGNILKNAPPEPVHFYKNEEGKPNITLKANWERELLITL